MSSVISASTTSTTALTLSGDTSGQLEIKTGSGPTTAVTITSGQNVGVGLTNPTAILHISSASQPYLKITYAAQREYSLTVTGSATTDGLAIRDESGSLEIARFCRSGNVGIGRTPVAYGSFRVLDVAGSTGSIQKWIHTGSTVELQAYASSTLTAVGSATNHPLLFTTNDAERMRITTDGEVLVGGTTSINAATGCLTVQRTNDDPYFALFRNDTSIANTNRIGNIDWYVNDTTSNTPTRVAYILGVASGDHSAGNNQTDLTFATTAASSATVTERMRIDASGNVIVKNNAADNNYFELQGSQGELRLYPPRTGADYGRISTDLGAGLVFETNGALERGRFTSGGYFKASNSGAYFNSAGTYHEFRNSAGSNLVTYFTHTAAANPYGIAIDFTAATPNNTTEYFIGCGDSTNTKFIVYSSGTVQNRTGTYTTISDLKLKENVVDTSSKLEKLNQVRVVNYNLIGDELKQIGFVAQELEQVFPSLVFDVPDLDENREPTGETTKGVKLSVFIPILVKAIQELKAELDEAKAEIQALKGAK
jgi:hypothetical protein